jgi:hypothetical protein
MAAEDAGGRIETGRQPAVKEWDDRPLPIDVREMLGVLMDSPLTQHRLRLKDADGRKLVDVSGNLIGPDFGEQEGDEFAQFLVNAAGFSITVKIPVHEDSTTTIYVDGKMINELPNGASWSTTIL